MNDQLLADRYQLRTELGQGGMGVVYRAWDTLLQRHVAIKVVSPTLLGTEGRVRLLQEAQAAAALNHPNIVAIYDVAQDGESPGTRVARPIGALRRTTNCCTTPSRTAVKRHVADSLRRAC